MNKLYINVECTCYKDGTVRPNIIRWPDGRCWKVIRTLHICEASDNEFEGIRYTVLIGSAEKYIYRLGSKWYVEPVQVEVDIS